MEELSFYQIGPESYVPFTCKKCGKCCLLGSPLMVEPLDAFRMAKYLGEDGRGLAKVIEEYLTPLYLDPVGFPVMVMQTRGPNMKCVAHSVLGCGIYPARPRVCKLYPLLVTPGEEPGELLYAATAENGHHFGKAGGFRVADWLHRFMTEEDREFMALEAKNVQELAPFCVSGRDESLQAILVYRYVMYDLEKPFLPQYKVNHHNLVRLLLDLAS